MSLITEAAKMPVTFKVTNTDLPEGHVVNDYLKLVGVKAYLNLILTIGPLVVAESIELHDPELAAALMKNPGFAQAYAAASNQDPTPAA